MSSRRRSGTRTDSSRRDAACLRCTATDPDSDVAAEDLTDRFFLDIGRDVVVDAQWADNGPGWVALLLTDAETVLALHLNAAGADRFSAVGVIGPYPPRSEVDFEVRAFILLDGLA